MATSLVMPALEMAQESGVLVRWLKQDGEQVTKGEPIMEIETDKATVEIEAPATGLLGGILVNEGDAVPVGQTIAWILSPGETPPAIDPTPAGRTISQPGSSTTKLPPPEPQRSTYSEISPVARKIAQQHGIDLALVKSDTGRIEKADVLAFVRAQAAPAVSATSAFPRLSPASPKARKLAAERGLNLTNITGSGPEGAVVTADVLALANRAWPPGGLETPGTVWRVMAERMTRSWTTVPHFFLLREVDAGNLVEWRKRSAPSLAQRTGIKLTYTDLLIKILAFTLRAHPRLNAAWADGNVLFNQEINVGIATAIDEGLVVPVIYRADTATLNEIAAQRHDRTERAHNRKLRPADLAGGTFTLSNLGMYNVDAFNAIVNTPQAAILAVGRIVDRVVPVNGQPAVRPMINLSLSCDHRVVDGARAAQFLDDLAETIEVPWRLLS
jgi:pyruvate dehydrogenase E2 component (dihydrolipoyllysine-residue acetyltransferase)